MSSAGKYFWAFLDKVDEGSHRLIRSTKYYPAIFSFFLGSATAFYFRDELNFPTYLRIKQAYLTNASRQMMEPDSRVLRVIDPLTFVQARTLASKEVEEQSKTYDDLVREQYQ